MHDMGACCFECQALTLPPSWTHLYLRYETPPPVFPVLLHTMYICEPDLHQVWRGHSQLLPDLGPILEWAQLNPTFSHLPSFVMLLCDSL